MDIGKLKSPTDNDCHLIQILINIYNVSRQ